MYNPKISDDLIQKLYLVRKAMKKPMTKVVDDILREYLEGIEIIEERAPMEVSTSGIYKIVRKSKNGK